MPNLVAFAIRGSLGKPVLRSTKDIRFRTASLASIALLAVFTMCNPTTTKALAAESPSVPSRMHLSDTMKKSADWLASSSLIPIDFSANIGDLVTEEAAVVGTDILSKNTGPSGSICFVVRRPG